MNSEFTQSNTLSNKSDFLEQCKATLKRNPRASIFVAGMIASAGIYFAYRTMSRQSVGQTLKPADSQFSLHSSLLTNEEALMRADIISQIEYNLTLYLKPGSDYEGRVTITFDLANNEEDIFVDYNGKNVKKMSLNNRALAVHKTFSDKRICIPKSSLKKGRNTLRINFENHYSTHTNGLTSFMDTDQNQYISSQCYPYYTSNVFPCFEQPDLKGSFKLKIIASASWKVIANGTIDSTKMLSNENFKQYSFTDFDSNLLLTKFQKTPMICPSLFSINSGPYIEIPSETCYNNVKMSLYFRQATEVYARKISQTIFAAISLGMKYCEDFLKIPYAFEKFDVIFHPGFYEEVVENIGTIIVSESQYLSKGNETEVEKSDLIFILLNGLSYAWFEGFVSTKSLHDLWFNQSLARLLTYLILENYDELKAYFPHAWIDFLFKKEKSFSQYGYAQALVDSDDITKVQYDEIKILKGVAVLKQLVYSIGSSNFKDALTYYFNTYKWKNVNIDSFFNALKYVIQARNLDFDLDSWKADWIYSAGYNELNIFFNTENKLTELTILQNAVSKEFPKLRDHRTKVGLYYQDGSCTVIELEIVSEPKSDLYVGRLDKPTAVLLNYDDEDFIKTEIDKRSLEYFKDNLQLVEKGLARSLVWQCLFNMVRNGKINMLEYIEFFNSQVVHERETIILNNIFVITKKLVENYIPQNLLPEIKSKTFNILLQKLKSNVFGSQANRQIYIANLPLFAEKEEDILTLAKLFDETTPTMEFTRTGVLHFLQIVSVKGLLDKSIKEKLFERINDKSSFIFNEKKRLETLETINSIEREKLWKSFINPTPQLSYQTLQAMMEGFNSRHHSINNRPYIKKFFDSVLSVYEKNPLTYFKIFYESLFPYWSEDYQELLDQMEKLLRTFHKQSTIFVKFLLESKEEVERIRKNKTLCVMNQSDANSSFTWMKSSRLLQSSQSFDIEFKGNLVTTQRLNKSTFLQETIRTTYTERPPLEEFKVSESQKINDLAFSKTQGQINHSNEENFSLRESQYMEAGIEDHNLLSGRQDLRISINTTEDKKSILDESSILSGEKVEDEEEGVKYILKKRWKKQTSFNKAESIFKDWRTNNNAVYEKMFRADIKNFAIDKYIPSLDEQKIILENLLQKHYVKLVLVFIHYQSQSEKYPEISWKSFSDICQKTKKIFGPTLGLKDLDQIFINEAQSSPKVLASRHKEKTFCRYEFIEVILRMAIKKYMNKNEITSYNTAIDKFLENDFFPYMKSADYSYEGFRYEKIQTETVDAALKSHEKLLTEIFKIYKENETEVIKYEDIQKIIEKGNFEIVNEELLKCFALSKMLVIDELDPKNKIQLALEFPEFLEFVVRVAEVIVETELPTYQKIENVMPNFTASLVNYNS